MKYMILRFCSLIILLFGGKFVGSRAQTTAGATTGTTNVPTTAQNGANGIGNSKFDYKIRT